MKNCYNQLRAQQRSIITNQASSSFQPPRRLWNAIWKLHTMPKLRSFLWSLCNNALATRENLYKRHILPNPACCICANQVPETPEHLFLFCPWTRDVWNHPALAIRSPIMAVHRIEIWLLQFIDSKGNLPTLETITSVLWHIWKARNAFLFRKQQPKTDQVVHVAITEAQSRGIFNTPVSRSGSK